MAARSLIHAFSPIQGMRGAVGARAYQHAPACSVLQLVGFPP